MDIVKSSKARQAALDLARKEMHPAVLNHCILVYLYAQQVSQPSAHLFIARVLHDFGVCECCPGKERFEVEGADRAVNLMKQYETFSKEDCHDVWVAIALHTSPGIAERITPMASIPRHAVLIDFHGRDTSNPECEKGYPRLEIEKILGDAVVKQAMESPELSAPPASWQGLLYRSHMQNPSYKGVNKLFGLAFF
jgi:hypothetical protein